MDALDAALGSISGYVWGLPLLILLFGTHLYLTFRLRFIQRHIFTAIRLTLKRPEGAAGDVSPLGALSTDLAATIGTGNIVGVATALALGGPGALFWVWLSGFFGIATKYTESLLAVKYRIQTPNGTMAGGPMYVLERGLGWKWAGTLFATLTAVAAFGIGCMVQSNSISMLLAESYHVPKALTGIVLAGLAAAVILGGIKRIARVTTFLVPFMAVAYLLGCFVLLAMGWQTIPGSILLILRSAFSGHAATGGFAGVTIMMVVRYGIARGLFSNEAGMGSAPIVAAAAKTPNPVHQGLVSATGPFWDTVIVCAVTGLVLVNTGVWQMGSEGPSIAREAFARIPKVGSLILSLCLLTFVFSTIIGWSYYGEKAIEYLVGSKGIKPYRVLWCVVVFFGATFSVSVVWNFADLANGLMVIPNLISLLLLSGVAVRETKKYLWNGPTIHG